MTRLVCGISQGFIFPFKKTLCRRYKLILASQKLVFCMDANYFFLQKHKDRQSQRAVDLSLLPHLFHNHARARAAVGLSLALVSHRRNPTYT